MLNLRHLSKLIWNRRKLNFLTILEIFVSYLVLFVLIQSFLKIAFNYSKPLGFEYQHILVLNMSWQRELMDNSQLRDRIEIIKDLAGSFPQVENLAEADVVPFDRSRWLSPVKLENREIQTQIMRGDRNYREVLEIPLLAGRWFEEQDAISDRLPLVVNLKMKESLFGKEEALGKIVELWGHEAIIVGIIGDFRKNGELQEIGNLTFTPIFPERKGASPGRSLLIKVKPGTGIVLEANMLRQLYHAVPNINTSIETLTDMRHSRFGIYLLPVIIFALVSLFMIINVCLGLFGVLWYNINFRREEIGLRRALGSTATGIYRQFVLESLVLTTFGLIIASFFVFQLVILKTNIMDSLIFYTSFGLSLLIIYGITAFCAFYPSRLAARIDPAEALHYE